MKNVRALPFRYHDSYITFAGLLFTFLVTILVKGLPLFFDVTGIADYCFSGGLLSFQS
ncbi:hypothetical protein [Enterococcus sp. AZ109]|uniref:hypothetical protein n=1 Tax=Enterococcus sp. AZ109 TaxID=2774634 RepID=UPI003F6859A6